MEKKVSFKNNKGTTLKGILHLPSGSGPFPGVVMVHGRSGSSFKPRSKKMADDLARKRIVALRFNLSAHKPSGGSWQDRNIAQFVKDTKTAINFLRKQKLIDKNRIGLVGNSMGGMIILLVASTLKNLKTIITVSASCGGKILEDKIKKGAAKTFKDYVFLTKERERWPKSYFTLWPEKKILEKVKKIKVPLLIIHGDQDDITPLEMGKKIFQAAKKPKKIIIIKGVGHFFRNQNLNLLSKITTNWFARHL